MGNTDLIKPCPCCGTNPLVTEHVVYRIVCCSCGTHTNKGRIDEVTINWNEGRSEGAVVDRRSTQHKDLVDAIVRKQHE